MNTLFQYARKSQWIWAFIVLPAINITALSMCDPLHENITHIAYALNQLPFVFLWAITCASYLFLYTYMFINAVQYKKSIGIYLLMLSCIGMVISVCIPYEANPVSLISKLHVDLAMVSTLLYIILLFHILYHCYFYRNALCLQLLKPTITLIGSLSMLFLLMGSISTLIESLFVIGMGILLYIAQKKTA